VVVVVGGVEWDLKQHENRRSAPLLAAAAASRHPRGAPAADGGLGPYAVV